MVVINNNFLLPYYGLVISIFALVVSLPVEVIYTGEGCDCPSHLNYKINIPKLPSPKKPTPSEIDYKIDVPVQAKAKVSYSFDFTVEEPKPPKPKCPTVLDLYTKIDKIAVKKTDCKSSYAPVPPRPCACQCHYERPIIYGYVRRNFLPCKCQGTHCRCNLSRMQLPNSIQKIDFNSPKIKSDSNTKRNKRDLRSSFLKSRTSRKAIRQGRYIKKYSKSLPENQNGLYVIEDMFDPLAKKSKRRQFKKLVKRDIKGEYDLLEKERDQADLTLPEIVQYMPEVLQKNFKRGQCQFGCTLCQSQHSENPKDNNELNKNEVDDSIKDANSDPIRAIKQPDVNADTLEKKITYNKRSANNYNYETDLRFPIMYQQNNAHTAQSLPQLLSNPTLLATFPPQMNAYAYNTPTKLKSFHDDQYFVNLYSKNRNNPMHYQYAGELDGGHGRNTHYPIEHISNEQLDSIIADIVYRHPSFIDISSHYGGQLVDPEPYQEEQTKSFLKKLLQGRLRLTFDDEDDINTPYTTFNPDQSYAFNLLDTLI